MHIYPFLDKVDLTPAGEQKIIQFCVKNEEHLSYKSVINYVKVIVRYLGTFVFESDFKRDMSDSQWFPVSTLIVDHIVGFYSLNSENVGNFLNFLL